MNKADLQQNLCHTLARIQDNLERAREEGFDTPQCWYIADRLQAIKEECENGIRVVDIAQGGL